TIRSISELPWQGTKRREQRDPTRSRARQQRGAVAPTNRVDANVDSPDSASTTALHPVTCCPRELVSRRQCHQPIRVDAEPAAIRAARLAAAARIRTKRTFMLNHAHLRDRFPPELHFQRYRFRFARYKRCDRYSMTPALTHSRNLSVRETSHVKYEAPDFSRRGRRGGNGRRPLPHGWYSFQRQPI